MVVVKKVIKSLRKDGWVLVSQKGSHLKNTKKAHRFVLFPTIKVISLRVLYQTL